MGTILSIQWGNRLEGMGSDWHVDLGEDNIYVLEGAWPPKEFGVSSLGDDSKDDGLIVADDNTQVHWIGLHDSR